MKASNPEQPPRHLGSAGRATYRTLQAEYGILDAGGLAVLVVACECQDRMLAARKAIEEHGPITLDRYGQPRVSPACQLEKDARGQFLQAIKLLGIDVDPQTLKGGRR